MTKIYLLFGKKYWSINKLIEFLFFVLNELFDFLDYIWIFFRVFRTISKKKIRIVEKLEKFRMNSEINEFIYYEKIK